MKTIICDIDGTIFKYQGGTPEVTNNRVEPLPGAIKLEREKGFKEYDWGEVGLTKMKF